VHLSETCDDEMPNLLTTITTTQATTSDAAVLPEIQEKVAARDLTPTEHIVDAGYMSADHLLTSQREHAIELLGPVAEDPSWQAKAGEGFAAAQFVIEWERRRARCPQGKDSVWWQARQDRDGHEAIHIKFAPQDCQACPVQTQCTRSASQSRRLVLRNREHYEALQVARERQQSELFQAEYARRAGIEGTISQGTHTGDLRRSRYFGFPKTRLMHLLLGAALNFMRVAAWLAETPRSRTRPAAFAALGQRMQLTATG
jgi:transposase